MGRFANNNRSKNDLNDDVEFSRKKKDLGIPLVFDKCQLKQASYSKCMQ